MCLSRLCVWTLLVPKGMHILLNFSHFDVEPDTFCDYDSLLVYSKDDRLVGELLFTDSMKYFRKPINISKVLIKLDPLVLGCVSLHVTH